MENVAIVKFVPVIKFDKDNEVIFFQDHSWWKGVPDDVEFKFREVSNNSIWLIADGYGTKEHYGNGAIAINKKYFPDDLLNQLTK